MLRGHHEWASFLSARFLEVVLEYVGVSILLPSIRFIRDAHHATIFILSSRCILSVCCQDFCLCVVKKFVCLVADFSSVLCASAVCLIAEALFVLCAV